MTSSSFSIPQGDTFDALKVPYIFDNDIGPIVAPQVAGCGDGKWVYDDNMCIVETTHNPTRAQELARARALRAQEAHKFIMEWKETKMTAVDVNDGGGDIDDDDDDYIDIDKLAPINKKQKTSVPRTQERMNEGELLSMCEIIQRTRASTGRVDLMIVTPDGHKFRSKSAAKQHMLETKQYICAS